ncbi:hypothetical protein LINGRAHAP2_LOCUS33697 [Linum grandiflorum]
MCSCDHDLAVARYCQAYIDEDFGRKKACWIGGFGQEKCPCCYCS